MSESHLWHFSYKKKTEELRLYNLFYNLTVPKPGLKAVFSNASPG
jgi:hypothetical protein